MGYCLGSFCSMVYYDALLACISYFVFLFCSHVLAYKLFCSHLLAILSPSWEGQHINPINSCLTKIIHNKE